jgi:hypothetical protein
MPVTRSNKSTASLAERDKPEAGRLACRAAETRRALSDTAGAGCRYVPSSSAQPSSEQLHRHAKLDLNQLEQADDASFAAGTERRRRGRRPMPTIAAPPNAFRCRCRA